MDRCPDRSTNLRVTDEHNLSLGTLLIESIHSFRDRRGASLDRVAVLNTATLALATAGRVVDSLGRGTGVGLDDGLDNRACSSHAGGSGRLPGTEDMDWRAARLTSFVLERGGKSAGGEENGSSERDHFERIFRDSTLGYQRVSMYETSNFKPPFLYENRLGAHLTLSSLVDVDCDIPNAID